MSAPRTCRTCGTSFEGERWQRECWPCWRREKDRQADRDAYERGYRDAMGAAGRQGVRLDPDLLRRAIALCHPDRHPERFEEANKVTSWLLGLRGELAA